MTYGAIGETYGGPSGTYADLGGEAPAQGFFEIA